MDKALLIGINAYRSAPLAGCVNDVSIMAELLVSRFRFDEGSIRMLADGRATTANIRSALEWLVDVDSGRCMFHFSGHGVQVPTRNFRQEIDGLDEVLCPVDFDWTERNLIRDKELYNVFRKIPSGVKFAWVNDSCHSGDLTRDMPKNPEIQRTILPPADIRWDIRVALKNGLNPVLMSPANNVLEVHNRSVTNGELDVGFVSGCKSDQTSADTVINGFPCGAMTWHLAKYLKQLPEMTSLVDVVKAVCDELASKGYSQRPQAEGSRRDKPFLS